MFKVVIPARHASTRLPGKPLLVIAGKPMLQWVYERACAAQADEVLIATDDERIAAAPEIPTVDEAGLPGFYIAIWHGYWMPKGAPKEAIARFNAAIVEALADEAVRKRLVELGQAIPAREQQTPEALHAHHKTEIEKWWPIVKQAGIKVE